MASNHAEIWKALKDHLEAYPGKPSLIAYGGESFDPPSPSVQYWIVDDLRLEPLRVYYGTRDPNWVSGALIINVMIPLNWDSLQSAESAGALADYFEQDTEIAYGSTVVNVSNQPYISTAGYRDGSHFRLPVKVSWQGWGR